MQDIQPNLTRLTNLTLSVAETVVHEAGRLLFGFVLGKARDFFGTPEPLGIPQSALWRSLRKKAADGALLAGPRGRNEYAKFTLKKGLPTDRRPRALAIENQPHSVDDFNGTIKEGYGKGGKRSFIPAWALSRSVEAAKLARSTSTHTMQREQASIMTSSPRELTRTQNPSRSISLTVR